VRAPLVVVLAVCVLAACKPTVTVYQRTSPRRVEVAKRASPPTLHVDATRKPSGEVAIHVKHSNLVALSRILHYNASAMIYGHSGNPIAEFGEMVFGVLMVVVLGGVWGMDDHLDGQNTATRKTERHRRILLALFDPTTSVFSSNVTTQPIVKKQVFSDPPIVREYEIRLPAANTQINYRLLDEAGREVERGSKTTDVHGEVLTTAAANAIAVEVVAEGKTLVVPILARAVEPLMVAPAPAAAPTKPLLNEGWTILRKRKRKIPHVFVSVDGAPTLFSGIGASVEVRIMPKLSASALISRVVAGYVITDGSELEGTAIEGGGQLRYYPLGDFGRGLHVGLEGTKGTIDIALGSGTRNRTRIGVFGGYKYTTDVGFTTNFALGFRSESDDDAMGGNLLQSTDLFGHLDVGWSF
jgi:hypothetical protein